jgi:hypothetical protein
LAGFSRSLNLQLACQTAVAPRVPGQPVQSFDTLMFRMQGQMIGDPDFDLLRITSGNDFSLPSPGHTTLTQLPSGDWAVDSFFDINYRIDFVGSAGGALSGMSGSTTGTIHMAAGAEPSCIGGCPPGMVCQKTRTVLADGTIDICCTCVPSCQCIGDLNGNCVINGADIALFVKCLLPPPAIPPACDCADINGDGNLNMADVNPFVTLLLQIPKATCGPNCIPLP